MFRDQKKNRQISVEAIPPRRNSAGDNAENTRAVLKLSSLPDSFNAVKESNRAVPAKAM